MEGNINFSLHMSNTDLRSFKCTKTTQAIIPQYVSDQVKLVSNICYPYVMSFI